MLKYLVAAVASAFFAATAAPQEFDQETLERCIGVYQITADRAGHAVKSSTLKANIHNLDTADDYAARVEMLTELASPDGNAGEQTLWEMEVNRAASKRYRNKSYDFILLGQDLTACDMAFGVSPAVAVPIFYNYEPYSHYGSAKATMKAQTMDRYLCLASILELDERAAYAAYPDTQTRHIEVASSYIELIGEDTFQIEDGVDAAKSIMNDIIQRAVEYPFEGINDQTLVDYVDTNCPR